MPHTNLPWERSLLAAVTLAGASQGAIASTAPMDLERKRSASSIEHAVPQAGFSEPLARVALGPAADRGRPASHGPQRPAAGPQAPAEGLEHAAPGPLGTALTLIGGAAILALRRRARDKGLD